MPKWIIQSCCWGTFPKYAVVLCTLCIASAVFAVTSRVSQVSPVFHVWVVYIPLCVWMYVCLCTYMYIKLQHTANYRVCLALYSLWDVCVTLLDITGTWILLSTYGIQDFALEGEGGGGADVPTNKIWGGHPVILNVEKALCMLISSVHVHVHATYMQCTCNLHV